MATREELVEHLWQEVINPLENPAILNNIVANCKRQPDAAFAQVSPAIELALAAGVSPADICLLYRSATYEAVFATLYAIGGPGVDSNVVFGLYENLGTATHAKW